MTDVANRSVRVVPWTALLVGIVGLALIAGAVLPAIGSVSPQAGKLLWLLSALGVGLVAAAVCGAAGAWTFGLLSGALIWGGAGQLWLTVPDWFPMLRIRPEGWVDLLAVLLIALQGAAALAAIAHSGAAGRILTGFRRFGLVTLAVIFALSVLVSVSPMGFALGGGHWMSYGIRLVISAGLICIDVLVIAALLSSASPALTVRLPSVAVAAMLALAGAMAFAIFGFEGLPHTEDEAVYILQAKTFLGGNLTAPAPPEALWPGLEYYLLEFRDGRWIGTPPPGWPTVLAIGVAFGVPWLVNPVLAALSVLASGALAQRIWGPAVGILTALLLACSPWFLTTAGTLMPHLASLPLMLVSWILLLKARDDGTLWPALVAGLAMGGLFVVRQLEGLMIGVMTGLWLLSLVRTPGGFLRGVLYSAGCIAVGSLYLVANYLVTGSALIAPLKRYTDDTWGSGGNAYGFGPDIGPPDGWNGLDIAPGHSVFEGVMNTAQSLAMIDMDFFGWGIGSLVLVWLGLALRRPDRATVGFLILIAVVAGALFLYWAPGTFYIGARYWFLMIFPLAAISALGFFALQQRLVAGGLAPRAPWAVLTVLCLFSLAVYSPWQISQHYRGFRGSTDAVRAAHFPGDALVFVDIPDYGSALFLNDPYLRDGRPIYLRDLGPEVNAAAAAALPERTIHYLEGVSTASD